MTVFSKLTEDPRSKLLPLEVYDSVVRSLHGDARTLFLGNIATSSAALISWYKSGQWTLFVCSMIIVLIASLRTVTVFSFNKNADKKLDARALKKAEWKYRIMSSAYVGSLGIWCFVSLGVSSDEVVHLIAITTTLANVAGISGRNFASERVINSQTIAVTLPLTIGLLMFGGPYHTFLACLLLPFLLAIQSISARLRKMLFDATFSAIDYRTVADQFEVALENASHGMAMIDNDGSFLVVNERFNSLFGFPTGYQTVGKNLFASDPLIEGLVGPSLGSSGFCERVRSCLQEGKKQRFVQTRGDGTTIEVSFNPMADRAGVIVLEDVSERIKSEIEIRQLANFDPLTHLPNRRHFTNLVKARINSKNPTGTFALFFADLDNFKNINDSLGHPVGDKLLCSVSLRMKSCLPADGMICRFGGDEFVIVLPNASSKTECDKLAQRIIEEVSKPVLIDGNLIIVGSSIGIVMSPEHGNDFDQLLTMADVALYEAKSRGRGIAHFYNDALGEQIKERRKLEVDLRRAVQRGELSVHYQPLIDLKQNKVSCCEALVRWNHPELGPISPAVFIPMAEEIGIIAKIGKFVLEEATTECSQWPGKTRVAVNVSSLQFQQSNVCNVVSAALIKSGLAADRLEIEVTESAVLDDLQETSRILRTLAQGGIRISLDDFGTGFSSLSYLHQLPLDKVKIDRSFIESIRDDDRALILLSGVTRMARDLGLLVIVEGVEEEEQLEILKREVHLDQVQGFLFSKAMPKQEVRKFLTDFGVVDQQTDSLKSA
jgi:diguanylate cyclase (GGDEF)-like protein